VPDVTNKPDDWQILAVALLRKLGGKVQLGMHEIADVRELLDPIEHETIIVTYHESLLAPHQLTVELRTRPRTVNQALDAFLDEVLKGAT
jgi:hypothetical protein